MDNRNSSGMTRVLPWILGCACVVTIALSAASANAQDRRDRREPERADPQGRFHSPHWLFDDRYGHRHYYPSVGYAVPALPRGVIPINYGRGRYYFSAGVWFQPTEAGTFVVVRPPVGIPVPVLPPTYTVVLVGAAPYYYANDVYYAAAPSGSGYVVMQPPGDAAVAPATR